MDEPVDTYAMGQEVVFPPGAIDFGAKAFVTVSDEVVGISFVGANVNITD